MAHKLLELPKLTASERHRRYVGPQGHYDIASATQFMLLITLGLREYHRVLDLGCGSLRVGRLLIPYLASGRYFGLDPARWVVEEGLTREVGRELLRIKEPRFQYRADFELSAFKAQFDFILANSIFTHASQSQIQKCFQEARLSLSASGLLVATFLEGPTDYADVAWVYPECIQYTFDCLQQLAAEQGLSCARLCWPHPGNQSWMACGGSGAIAELSTMLTQPTPEGRKFIEQLIPGRVQRSAAVDAVEFAQDVANRTPSDSAVVVVAGDQFAEAISGMRNLVSFDAGGEGPPADSHQAMNRLEQRRQQGAAFLAFPPHAFWWLEHYAEFRNDLYARFARVADSPRLVLFDLRKELEDGYVAR
jgi:SAM-dependent methyltransferase